jgi:hypothetical protein
MFYFYRSVKTTDTRFNSTQSHNGIFLGATTQVLDVCRQSATLLFLTCLIGIDYVLLKPVKVTDRFEVTVVTVTLRAAVQSAEIVGDSFIDSWH